MNAKRSLNYHTCYLYTLQIPSMPLNLCILSHLDLFEEFSTISQHYTDLRVLNLQLTIIITSPFVSLVKFSKVD